MPSFAVEFAGAANVYHKVRWKFVVDFSEQNGWNWKDWLLNLQRREQHGELTLPNVELKEPNPKTKYSRARYEREKNDNEKSLEMGSQNQRRKLEYIACSKGVKNKLMVSNIVKIEIDEKMSVYDSDESQQQRIRRLDELEARRSRDPGEAILPTDEQMLELETEQAAVLATDEQMVQLEMRKAVETRREENMLETEKVKTEKVETEKLQHSTSIELAPLSMKEETQVNNALTRSDKNEVLVVHAKSNIEIRKDDIRCLLPREWLNDSVIDLYFELLKKRQERDPTRYLNCHFFSTLFYVMVAFLKDEATYKCWNLDIVECLEHENVDDCGVYMLLYADFHSRGLRPNFKQEDIP